MTGNRAPSLVVRLLFPRLLLRHPHQHGPARVPELPDPAARLLQQAEHRRFGDVDDVARLQTLDAEERAEGLCGPLRGHPGLLPRGAGGVRELFFF